MIQVRYLDFRFHINFTMKISLTLLSLFALLVFNAAGITLHEEHELSITHEFCWKDTYGRGAGSIPTECGNRRKIWLLCYDHCPPNTVAIGFDCHSVCPSHMRDDGLYCRLAEYGRGVGYSWQFGDWWFSSHGQFLRCERDYGQGNCEQHLAVVYPKCKSGFHAVGCCICRPNEAPNCPQYGLDWSPVSLSCYKKIHYGAPKPMSCGSHLQSQAGLCYTQCRSGFHGVGPICWANVPNGWTDCGMGAAPTSGKCANIIFNQVVSIAESAVKIALLIVTSGTSSATAGAGGSWSPEQIAQIKNQLDAVLKALQLSKQVEKIVNTAENIKKNYNHSSHPSKEEQEKLGQAQELLETVSEANEIDLNKVTVADMLRLSARLGAVFDPTGLANVVANFTYPRCSEIKK